MIILKTCFLTLGWGGFIYSCLSWYILQNQNGNKFRVLIGQLLTFSNSTTGIRVKSLDKNGDHLSWVSFIKIENTAIYCFFCWLVIRHHFEEVYPTNILLLSSLKFFHKLNLWSLFASLELKPYCILLTHLLISSSVEEQNIQKIKKKKQLVSPLNRKHISVIISTTCHIVVKFF